MSGGKIAEIIDMDEAASNTAKNMDITKECSARWTGR